MKPADLKDTKKSRGTARVKMLMRAHLFWLQGYPSLEDGTLMWCSPLSSDSEKRKIEVSDKKLSKAVRTINELQREYPKALPEVVGDVAEWTGRAKAYLEYVKELYDFLNTDKGGEIFSLFDRDSTYRTDLLKSGYVRSGGTQTLVTAISWLHYVQREPVIPSLRCIMRYTGELTSIADNSVSAAVELIHLSCLEPGRLQDLMWLVADFDRAVVVTVGVDAYVRPFSTAKFTKSNKSNKSHKKEFASRQNLPSVKINIVFDFLDWLVHAKNDQRKLALQLFNGIKLKDYFTEWQAWWVLADPIIKKITTNIKYISEQKYQTVYRMQGDLSRLLDRTPGEYNLKHVLDSVRSLASSTKLGSAALKNINICSGANAGYPHALALLGHISQTNHEYGQDIKLLVVYFEALAEFYKKYSKPKNIAPWLNLDRFYSTPESDLLDILDRQKAPVFFDVLHQVNVTAFRSVTSDELPPLAYCVASGVEIDRAIEVGGYLLNAGLLSELDETVAKICAALNADGVYAEKLVKLYRSTDSGLRDEHILEVCFKVFRRNNQLDLFKEIVDLNMFDRMVHTCYQLFVIQKIAGVDNIPSVVLKNARYDDWVDLYPEAIWPLVCELNGIIDSAESRVSKLVSKVWWPKSLLSKELAENKSRLGRVSEQQRPNLAKRIANFQGRLEKHKGITLEQSLKINEKLTHLVATERLNLWANTIYQQFKECWAKYFGFMPSDAPEWLYQDDMITQLLPIVDLEKGPRKLAIRIIKARGGSPPWNFEEEAGNVRFLDRISDQGIDVNKWVEGIGPRSYRTNASAQLHIYLSKDPLETINMGGHFKTCLSPGNFNFFSVFANIADINKHVIFAKNDLGKVVGRVLIGMTDGAGIKVFHRYFHDKHDRFEERVMEYINEWAQELGVILVREGGIQKLVAPDWYDDGAIDIDSGIDCFQDGSELRRNLSSMPSQQILAEITRQLAPLPINELTFPMIIQLDEIQGHGELISELITIAKKIERIDETTIVQLFMLSLANGCGEYCYSLFSKVLMRILQKQAIRGYWLDERLFSGLVQYDAVGILRVFNTVRRSKHFYMTPPLKAAAVEALQKLGRPKQAAKLLVSK